MSLPDPALPERFHRVLVDEIRERRPEYLREPFTVAEIYQELIPYRTHRDRLGVEMNADYEDTILRLLAGEGALLHLESDAARRELRSELDAPDPDTGLFRNFAAATVRLAKGSSPGVPDEGRADGAATDAVPDEKVPDEADRTDAARPEGTRPDTAGRSTSTPAADRPDEAAGRPPPAEPDPSGERAEEATFDGTTAAGDPPVVAPAPARDEDACPWCREELPERDDLHFCPFCGTSLDVVPCPECGEELERHWRFCVRCGTEVGA